MRRVKIVFSISVLLFQSIAEAKEANFPKKECDSTLQNEKAFDKQFISNKIELFSSDQYIEHYKIDVSIRDKSNPDDKNTEDLSVDYWNFTNDFDKEFTMLVNPKKNSECYFNISNYTVPAGLPFNKIELKIEGDNEKLELICQGINGYKVKSLTIAYYELFNRLNKKYYIFRSESGNLAYCPSGKFNEKSMSPKTLMKLTGTLLLGQTQIQFAKIVFSTLLISEMEKKFQMKQ